MDYPALRKLVEAQGLLNKTPWYYTRTASLLIVFFTGAWIVYYHFQNIYIQISIMCLLGFLGFRFGLLAHDAGHRAISAKKWLNETIGYISLTFINGISIHHWETKHNAHHKSPNFNPGDPDIEQVFAYDETQARARKGLLRWITKHQIAFFVPLHALSVFDMIRNSLQHVLLRCPLKRKMIELTGLLMHLALWIGIPSYFIGFWKAILLYVIGTLVRGLYASLVFVPNHVGMPHPKPTDKLTYLEKQVITARNLTPSPLKDYIFGGLNYQIEHHLFPNMSRKYLKKAKTIIKNYCQTHNIPYKETGFFTCYKDVFTHMSQVGKAA